ncbi:MAG: glycogen synthase [Victivallales bacterium]|jgi:ADP-glucose type glycogen/starch synthase|nr:glycogen synthase [Victivallales bacterium]
MRHTHPRRPKILVITPEITYLPKGIQANSDQVSAKAGGLADVSASLVSALYAMGADVHVAIPNYRRLFHREEKTPDVFEKKRSLYRTRLSEERIHLAQDRVFFYRNRVYSGYSSECMKISLAFQREVINNIIPEIQPDLIHCNDWMTGLIPAYARQMGIPSLFTVHNIHTQKTTMSEIENDGIDAAFFWKNLYFEREPYNYEESRNTNYVDFLTSGIFASHFINTVSPTFLQEIVNGQHGFIPAYIQREIANKYHAGCALGILNAPDVEENPATDKLLEANFDEHNFTEGKRLNKLAFQKATGLDVNPEAPLFFWPSRLDPIQKGPQLLAEILYTVIHENWNLQPQFAFVANGEYQQVFHSIAQQHGFQHLIAVLDFDEKMSHCAYAASDFILMPSRFEPCGLPQMVGPIYGSLPIVHDTGGLHDTVQHLDADHDTGNGFVFKFFDHVGLHWAINEAIKFYKLPVEVRNLQISRIMTESQRAFNHLNTANAYIQIYEKMLERPLVAWGDIAK